MNNQGFVPKVLLCGDESKFLSRIGNRPVKIVGRVQITGTVNTGESVYKLDFAKDGKVSFNDELKEVSSLRNFLQSEVADYFVFTEVSEFRFFVINAAKFGVYSFCFLTIEDFNSITSEFFYTYELEVKLIRHLKAAAIKTLLDVDCYFSKGVLFTKLENDFTEIDGITATPLFPIKENIYSHVYKKNFAEVGLKRYDAVLIAEREPVDFDGMFKLLENFSDTVITFARTGSELEKHLLASDFEKITPLPMETGKWYFLKRRKPPEDFAVYVVTHKPTPHDGKLPEGYKIIHAGREGNTDLGYIGDNTGDNVSRLNLYINEITALYWMWKNTSHSIIGLNHYRRFFTESDNANFAYDKILSKDAALKLLERYDMIVGTIHIGYVQRENFWLACGEQLTTLGESVIKKYLLQTQPDYLEAFDAVWNSKSFYKCNMFLTRRYIFDAYCKWLFSFFIDATEEILQSDAFKKVSVRQRRLMGFFSELMPTVWLIKNRVRIKELNIMFINDV
jgi:hypothetical protein